jgi:ubiquinone/menaquinone biosynthesis C-methylase UbiE
MLGRMRDIVDNRRRVPFANKLRLGLLVLRENGLLWTFYLGVYYLCSSVAELAFRRMHERARRLGLPGTSSARVNREVWNSWDWSAKGEEWSLSADWKDSLVQQVLRRYMPAGKDILEIGPGAGRWTEFLHPLASHLIGVDISQKCVDLCRERFGAAGNASFLTTSGSSLAGVADQSIDAIWSYDVFVHVDTEDAAAYVREFRRVLRPGGIGVVHHAREPMDGGWHSNLTAEAFRQLLLAQGFSVADQFESWKDGGEVVPVGRHRDVITVFHA